jgi:hypothetical protein
VLRSRFSRPVRLGLVAACVLALVAWPGTARAAGASTTGTGSTSAEQRLADTYRPVVMVRTYDHLCDSTGEPYVPMTVDAVLDNRQVALRQVGNGDPVITWAPTAKDLFGMGSGTYLDEPGDALAPGCVYATYSAQYTPLDRSAVYAHVATQRDRPGYLAVQYWLYWYYNDWNDRHEGDWEFIQVLFKADTVQEALGASPVSVGYAQHTGGETAAWTDAKLRKEGTHPVVYSSQGSHASYFAPALYLGRAASEGFGCDNTQSPSTRVTPRAVLLPDAPSGPDDPFAWLAFTGRWGERHSGPNNGPDGPMGKPRWTEPVTWQEGLRPTSFDIPGGSDTPPAVVGTFCTVVGKGSILFLEFAANPARVFTGLVLVFLLLVFLLRRTSWSQVPLRPVVARRRGGEIVRAAVRLYRRHPLAFLASGLLAVPIGLLTSAITALMVHLPYLGKAVEVSTAQAADTGNKVAITTGVATALWPVTVLLVSAVVVGILRDLDDLPDGRRHPVTLDPLRRVWRRGPDLARSYLPAVVLLVLLDLSVVGVPVAAWLTVRWVFVGQVVMVEDTVGTPALRRSGSLVAHRWWHTALFAFLIWSGIHVVAVALGLLALVAVTGLPLWVISLISLVVEVALTPLGAIALSLLYGDARAEQEDERAAAEPVPVG